MIAIKDMEMPNGCLECDLNNKYGIRCKMYDCPIIEIEQSEDCVSLKEVEKWLHQHVTISIPSVETQMFEQLEKELPRVTPTQSWIPISERLPRQEIEVLTFYEHGFIEIQSLEDGYWENQHGDCKDFADNNNVIAWQPLPKPYEDKRGNKVGWSSLENVREKVERGSEDGRNRRT